MVVTGFRGGRAFQIYAVLVQVAVIGLLVAAVIARNGGRFLYTLDDPYIHLALAEAILEGGYGINPGEYASPSSSILYPFLVALGLGAGAGAWGPLMLSVPFALAATWVLAGFAWEVSGAALRPVVALILGPALVLATNGFALPLTGMEHAIHVFATVLALTGLYRLAGDGSGAALWAVMAGCLIAALIRFEGLALWVAGIGALLALGRRGPALALVAAGAALLGAYAAGMGALGLPVFPSSVMTKSAIAAQAGEADLAGAIRGLSQNAMVAMDNRWGMLLALAALALLAASVEAAGRGRRVFCLAVAFVLAAHVAAGQYGWFGRYEVYAVAALLVGVLPLLAGWLRGPVASVALPLMVAVVGMPYLWTTAATPAAAANIHQQQDQMRRFVQEIMPQPVAVNDPGLVAYGNPNFVLDLWGLGSEEARRLSAEGGWTPARLEAITSARGVSYAMIYPDWFPEVPEGWCRIADLVTSRVTSASDTVAFYLIRRELESEMRAGLATLDAGLPAGARLTVLDCPAG